MKHILVPIGSKKNASNTLQYAIDFAKGIHAKVFVFRAYKAFSKAGTFINMNAILERETTLYINTMIRSADTKNVDIKMISAKGGTIESIREVHKQMGIDLIVAGPRSNSIKEEVFLGNTSGSIVKQTEIPVLIVPESYQFRPFKLALTAFKSGRLEKKDVLIPLKEIQQRFRTKVNLLLVKTPEYEDKDLVIDKSLQEIKNAFSTSENVTTFQGVLEHFQSNNPDLLCVFRRKKGFFQKLWEKNTIMKSEFHCSIPLLILSGRQ